jgi:mono/diheme cytochrome c family protein
VPAGSLQLAELLREERLAHAPTSWEHTPPTVVARTPRGRAALGYFQGNCSFCHNERDPVSSVGLSFRADLDGASADEQPAIRSAVGVPSKFQIRGVEPGRSQRLAAGDAERSAVLVRMRARDGISQMPPLGSKRVDVAALELISAWVVDELPGAERAR